MLIRLLPGLLLVALAACDAPAQPQQGPPPNIVFILTDDQRWDAVEVMGNPLIRTCTVHRFNVNGCHKQFKEFCDGTLFVSPRS
jgi:hypothetical protein